MFPYTTKLQEERNINVAWHFFVTSHGKGAVDGVGGTVKRAVFRAIKAQKACPTSAKEYAECAKWLMGAVSVIYVPEETVEARKGALDALWSLAKPVP